MEFLAGPVWTSGVDLVWRTLAVIAVYVILLSVMVAVTYVNIFEPRWFSSSSVGASPESEARKTPCVSRNHNEIHSSFQRNG